MALKHPRGTVVLVSQVPDPNGVNPKDRFVVLVRDWDDADALVFGVAITGSFNYPLPETAAKLPYHRQGRCKTGLTKESVADCTWIVAATPSDVVKRGGIVPPSELQRILEQVTSHLPAPPPPPSGDEGTR